MSIKRDTMPFTETRHITVGLGERTQRVQAMTCTHPGCTHTFEKKCQHKTYPVEAIAAFLRRKGWTVNPNKGVFLCPRHGEAS